MLTGQENVKRMRLERKSEPGRAWCAMLRSEGSPESVKAL